MTYQSQFNGYTAFKVQSGLGTAASGAGATLLRATGGKGQQSVQPIGSNEVRRDGMRTRGRHGSRRSTGSYPAELSLGTFDSLFEAVMRGTWASGTVITQATGAMSSATMSASGAVVTFSGGSVIAAGVRVGDVHRWTAGLNSADLNKNLRVVGVTATAITYAENLVTVTGPVATYSFATAGRKLLNPAAGSLVKRYFTIEEHEVDIDGSEVFQDCMWGQLRISMQPNGQITVTPMWTGTGAMTTCTGASAPVFTNPSETTSLPMCVNDATIRLGSSDLLDMTSFDLTIDIGLSAIDVAGSTVSPDVFDAPMTISGSITTLRSDLARVADALAETQLSLSVLATENEGNPKDFISFFLPNFTIPVPDKSELRREGGPRTQTIQIPGELVGIDSRGGAYDSTMIKIQTSYTP